MERQQEITPNLNSFTAKINVRVVVEILIAMLILIAIVLFLIMFGSALFHPTAGCTSLQSCAVNA